LYLKGKKNGKMMLESIENGPLVYPTIENNGTIRPKKYAELSEQEKLQDVVMFKQQTLFFKVFLWMCMPLSTIVRRIKKFRIESSCSCKGESLHEYYLCFTQLINDMHTIGMTMQQVQVNIKFLNALQPEWSKYITDVKLAKNMYNTNFDQLYAYLSQHKAHENEVRMMRDRYPDPLALVANYQTQSNSTQCP
ncbi:hypothetical protein Tco_0071020, partial [Tanacetum coccineum]